MTQAEAPWLWVCPPPDGAGMDALTVGELLRDYRATHGGLSQAALADMLGITQTYVSRIEGGTRQIRDVGLLYHIATCLGVPPSRLGLSHELVASVRLRAVKQEQAGPGRHGAAHPDDPSGSVQASGDEWRLVRSHLNQHRADLARVAARLYPPDVRVDRAPLLARPEWLPTRPIDFVDVQLEWADGPQALAVDGTESHAQSTCPLRAPGQRFERYTSAVRYLATPALFENRPSYRLLDVAWPATGHAKMRFGLATYFDKIDVSEAVGHEFAAACPRPDLFASQGSVEELWQQLPFRALLADPFDLRQRAVIPAITTLTLRRKPDGTAAFLLHWRDSSRVATAGGMYDAIPAGEFQPSSIAPWDITNDFDLWRNVVREFSEELLGTPEHDGSRSAPIDYECWPFYQALERARAEGRISALCLGVGLDALTLAATILTAVVIDNEVFDDVFGDIVRANAEGLTVVAARGQRAAEGVPFTAQNVERLLTREPMAPPGAACLALAWRHRKTLLTPSRPLT
jgi:transcriptional regulator with XRE-family HTH domain